MSNGSRRVTARWEIALSFRLWATRPLQDLIPDPRFVTTLEGCEVEIVLLLNEMPRQQSPSRGIAICCGNRLQLSVSRSEQSTIPPLVPVPAGQSDQFRSWNEATSERLRSFTAVALEVGNRFLLFFKYSLRTPLVKTLKSVDLLNPRWLDGNGDEIQTGLHQVAEFWDPPPFLERTLLEQAEPNLQYVLDHKAAATLPDELLLDAIDALREGNLRRAIIEAAVCVEVAVKDAFTFIYFDASGKYPATVSDLLSRVAMGVSGSSFESFNPTAFDHIRHLFWARNKAAHRGIVEYSDDAGNQHTATRQGAEEWLLSIERLLMWLSSE